MLSSVTAFVAASSFFVDIHIIDDDEGIRSILVLMAQSLGYSAMVFSGPDEYLEFVKGDDYSPPKLAALSDIEMPGMSGYEMMKIVRHAYPEQRFIMITGGAQPTSPVNGHACFYFNKPVTIDQLAKAFQTQSLCTRSGPDPESFGCDSFDDRRAFQIRDWHCPLKAG